jgi:hypothetical protein
MIHANTKSMEKSSYIWTQRFSSGMVKSTRSGYKRQTARSGSHASKEAGEIMRKLWRWAAVGVGATALAAGLAVTAMPADAATTQATTQITQSQRLAAPAACANKAYASGHVIFTYCDGTRTKTNCIVGNNGPLTGPEFAANGCDTQLYMYLGHTLTGVPALCVNPRTSTGVLKKYYEEFKVTSHQGAC